MAIDATIAKAEERIFCFSELVFQNACLAYHFFAPIDLTSVNFSIFSPIPLTSANFSGAGYRFIGFRTRWCGCRFVAIGDKTNQEALMSSSTDQKTRDTLAADETADLISSEKVEGTAVYDRKGDKIGTVHHLMINKYIGQVAYAVISFGGFLGIGAEYHPIPWRLLDFDEEVGATSSTSTGRNSRRLPALPRTVSPTGPIADISPKSTSIGSSFPNLLRATRQSWDATRLATSTSVSARA
jgi:hypothetical protein